ncbi:GNAT family N-acetyltransferase [Actinosynnema mirum]|uniref:GCN5-related N-acetyltransferase n=1 Tax=Actinosynnema mirum (strain ATCC 29888 / DSM 43827 / JCM 3225 / NBRC 14064 / NCIMB 13271 / NRRL B-12336 / IMRU 3971 / 101) TaxID=446462 RepID=C6WB51_ACTMD|nr:GNAT family N-acetyltransferase [Actinosynnema mirum]ACU39342.1 GCN5-related N-acetyltransferase [Actinosynnema mirum DSM 43827]
MTVARGLADAQSARLVGIDPVLPPMIAPLDGDVVTAALPDGTRVAGVLQQQVHERNSPARLWSATEVWELTPLLGGAGPAGMDALMRAWRRRMELVGPAERDSACVLTWPSRDVESGSVLMDHGMVPLSVVAVRRGPAPAARSGSLVIRRAKPSDLEAVLELAMAELRYSSMVGSTVNRPEAVALKRRALAERLAAGGPTWLAEREGVAVGLAECAMVLSEPGNSASTRLPPGRWGYVNCVSVLPGARGSGVGQQLMAHVHRELHLMGAVGTYLYYNPPNPLSSVFWPRQGYRPLWTMWEVRPAGALR